MERETRELNIGADHKAVIKTYLTYAELEPILEKADLSAIKKTGEILKLALVSVDGIAENAFEKISNLPIGCYSIVANEISKMVGDFQTAK